MSASEFSEQIQSLLYGKLEVEFANPTYVEQLEIVRALTANPSAYSRLRIKGPTHPWISRLLAASMPALATAGRSGSSKEGEGL